MYVYEYIYIYIYIIHIVERERGREILSSAARREGPTDSLPSRLPVCNDSYQDRHIVLHYSGSYYSRLVCYVIVWYIIL